MSCDSCSSRSGEARGLCEGDAEASTRSVRAVDSPTTDSATAETVGEGPGWTRGTMSILDCSSSMAGSSWWVARSGASLKRETSGGWMPLPFALALPLDRAGGIVSSATAGVETVRGVGRWGTHH